MEGEDESYGEDIYSCYNDFFFVSLNSPCIEQALLSSMDRNGSNIIRSKDDCNNDKGEMTKDGKEKHEYGEREIDKNIVIMMNNTEQVTKVEHKKGITDLSTVTTEAFDDDELCNGNEMACNNVSNELNNDGVDNRSGSASRSDSDDDMDGGDNANINPISNNSEDDDSERKRDKNEILEEEIMHALVKANKLLSEDIEQSRQREMHLLKTIHSMEMQLQNLNDSIRLLENDREIKRLESEKKRRKRGSSRMEKLDVLLGEGSINVDEYAIKLVAELEKQTTPNQYSPAYGYDTLTPLFNYDGKALDKIKSESVSNPRSISPVALSGFDNIESSPIREISTPASSTMIVNEEQLQRQRAASSSIIKSVLTDVISNAIETVVKKQQEIEEMSDNDSYDVDESNLDARNTPIPENLIKPTVIEIKNMDSKEILPTEIRREPMHLIQEKQGDEEAKNGLEKKPSRSENTSAVEKLVISSKKTDPEASSQIIIHVDMKVVRYLAMIILFLAITALSLMQIQGNINMVKVNEL